MPFSIEQAVKNLCEAAGWRMPMPDAEGAYRFFLEDGLDLAVSSPDGRQLVASAEIGAAPDAGDDEAWQRLGRLAAGAMRAQASELSLHEGQLTLSTRIDLSQAEAGDIDLAVKRFLNDQAWWREALGEERQLSAASSPFAMPNDWFQSNFPL